MRILMSSQTYEPERNGQAVFITNLAEGLIRKGHEVLVVLPSDSMKYKENSRNGVKLQYIPAFSLYPLYPSVHLTPVPSLWLRKIFDEFKPHIVHIQDHYFLSRGTAQIAKRRGIPIIGTNHFLPDNISSNLYIPDFLRSKMTPFINARLWSHMLSLYRTLDFVTAPSATAVRILREHGIRAAKAVSCGVNTTVFRPDIKVDSKRIRSEYGLGIDKVLLIFVGRVDREKRIDVLIKAFGELKNENIQLAIVGKGLYLPSLRKLSKELGLSENKVKFLGFVSKDNLPYLLRSSDIFVMPSDVELESIATLEAMSSGLPIIAASAGALPELVENDVNGYLFKSGDYKDLSLRINTMLENQAHWGKMGKESRRRAEPHSLENTISAYEKLYMDIRSANRIAFDFEDPLKSQLNKQWGTR